MQQTSDAVVHATKASSSQSTNPDPIGRCIQHSSVATVALVSGLEPSTTPFDQSMQQTTTAEVNEPYLSFSPSTGTSTSTSAGTRPIDQSMQQRSAAAVNVPILGFGLSTSSEPTEVWKDKAFELGAHRNRVLAYSPGPYQKMMVGVGDVCLADRSNWVARLWTLDNGTAHKLPVRRGVIQ
ncbi:hypothetical protein CC86DRAFT_388767 [Ophiobolus disseminans]|uniref:Uncharacterized protein n=1 Tax=Ophiobolus disseminans TaxID=1469910 RepID=A0A6A6ZD80_9PLEO|nr:hypothetical protein CC86DRAFT_388767 [Ophiobolus disseminans]